MRPKEHRKSGERDLGSPRSNIARDGCSVFDSRFCQIMHRLQVHPKFGAGVEEARQTKAVSAVTERSPFTIAPMRVAGTRKAIPSALIDIPRGLRNSSLSTSPGWAVTRLGVAIALVVVDDFDIGGPFLSPDETDAPLVVDPDGVLATTVAGQRFERVCWWRAQVVEFA